MAYRAKEQEYLDINLTLIEGASNFLSGSKSYSFGGLALSKGWFQMPFKS